MLLDPGEKLSETHAAEKKEKKSCGAAKREEASNCFPSVCDPETLEEFFLVLLLRVNQHSLLIWWHRLLHNMVL